MLNLSLRAVFRKESWMFCAGLLLSIADLLKFFDLQHSNLRPRQSLRALKPTACSSRTFPRQERGGETLLLRRLRFPRLRSTQVAASTIRRRPALFNLEL